jgi:hypothetical protein
MRLSLWGLWTQKDERVDLGGTRGPSSPLGFVNTTAPEGVGCIGPFEGGGGRDLGNDCLVKEIAS